MIAELGLYVAELLQGVNDGLDCCGSIDTRNRKLRAAERSLRVSAIQERSRGQSGRLHLQMPVSNVCTHFASVIVTPDLYERDRMVVTRSKFILAEGPLQNQDGVIHVKATRLQALSDFALEVRSHDFH